MEDKWRIKKIGDDWMFIPKKERDEKRDYENLTIKINQREKKIESDLGKIKELKKELRKMKSDRIKEFNKMIKYHKKFLPTFSIFLGGEDDGSPQWGVWVRIGGKRRYVYIGTVNEVSYHLDLIENNVPHYNKNNRYEDGVVGFYGKLNPINQNEGDLMMSKDFDIIKSKIESYVCDVIKKKMLGILKKDGNLDRFYDTKKYKLKGTDILFDLYKKTPHYTPPQKEREKKKGGTLRQLNVGKKKQY
ncbi:hypothetical protein OAB81_02985 [Flavobacteriaceae bacterium]|nr:hypothetical protein [Flavobacteriaceae bacterium]